MEQQQLNVDVTHFEDEDIWIATSDDIVGMVVESHAIAAFLADVVDVAIELLELNERISAKELEMTRLRLRVKHKSEDSSVAQDCSTPELQLTELQLAAP